MYTGRFEAPEPGAWEVESTHLMRPISRYLADVFPKAMNRGFSECTARYGALLDRLDVAVVEGFLYGCPRPVGAPKSAKGTPPRFVFTLLTWLHPEIRRRIKRSGDAFAGKLWREDLKRWDEEWRPEVDRTNAKLGSVDPAALDEAALAAHLADCHAALDHAIYRHHSLNMCAMIPCGDYLAQAGAWTNLSPMELLSPLRGASPVSAGATKELDAIARAIAADPKAASALDSAAPAADVLAELQRSGGPVAAALKAYLDVVGLRVLSGYDVADCYALEVPATLVTAIRAYVGAKRSSDTGAEAALARVRDAVPTDKRDAFDALFEEVRTVYRVRDERGYSNDARTTGLTRRALLEAGKRLAAKARLESPDHAVELTPGELQDVLAGKDGAPSAKDLAEYAAYRLSKTVADAPQRIGFPPSPPPPAEWLPGEAARMMRAVNAMMSAMFDVSSKRGTKEVLHGVPASAGTIEGPARIVAGPSSFSRVRPGDVLVAPTTGPTYNVLLPIIGGIVTDRGGALSHAAIVAREYGLPAVVGTVEATKLITDGRKVRVDGRTGDVFLL